jgi:hypothetical protein
MSFMQANADTLRELDLPVEFIAALSSLPQSTLCTRIRSVTLRPHKETAHNLSCLLKWSSLTTIKFLDSDSMNCLHIQNEADPSMGPLQLVRTFFPNIESLDLQLIFPNTDEANNLLVELPEWYATLPHLKSLLVPFVGSFEPIVEQMLVLLRSLASASTSTNATELFQKILKTMFKQRRTSSFRNVTAGTLPYWMVAGGKTRFVELQQLIATPGFPMSCLVQRGPNIGASSALSYMYAAYRQGDGIVATTDFIERQCRAMGDYTILKAEGAAFLHSNILELTQERIEFAVKTIGIDIDVRNSSGETALMVALNYNTAPSRSRSLEGTITVPHGKYIFPRTD